MSDRDVDVELQEARRLLDYFSVQSSSDAREAARLAQTVIDLTAEVKRLRRSLTIATNELDRLSISETHVAEQDLPDVRYIGPNQPKIRRNPFDFLGDSWEPLED